MSVLVKDMEMPTKENAVILITPSGNVWLIGDMPNEDTHLVKAKAVPIPEPHGRLIDANAMITSVKRQADFLKIMGGNLATVAEILEKGILQEIENAPTIIPASEEELA